MKKVLLLMTMVIAISSVASAAGTAPKNKPVKTKPAKAKPAKAGLCLAIFDLPCGWVFSFMDCTDMECTTDWGWEQKWNGYNTQFCNPVQSVNAPVAFG